eukprot:GHVL01012829.1.p1 GENE.GHVL01012829.1~~GHVL01012829.1.p1  ORF type:complete len:235 (-),score=37.71 GHVL01012829.1:1453-2157(-)
MLCQKAVLFNILKKSTDCVEGASWLLSSFLGAVDASRENRRHASHHLQHVLVFLLHCNIAELLKKLLGPVLTTSGGNDLLQKMNWLWSEIAISWIPEPLPDCLMKIAEYDIIQDEWKSSQFRRIPLFTFLSILLEIFIGFVEGSDDFIRECLLQIVSKAQSPINCGDSVELLHWLLRASPNPLVDRPGVFAILLDILPQLIDLIGVMTKSSAASANQRSISLTGKELIKTINNQ